MKPVQKPMVALLVGLCSAFTIAGSPAAAQDIASVDDGIFRSADVNNDGKISRREVINYTDLIFISVDSDTDGELTLEEFLAWDPGYVALAEKLGRVSQFNEAKETAFNSKDLNGDGVVEHDEYSVSSLYDFYQADINHDRSLSKEELIGEYRIVKEVRSALE